MNFFTIFKILNKAKHAAESSISALDHERKRILETTTLLEIERKKLFDTQISHQQETEVLNQNHRLEIKNIGELQR